MYYVYMLECADGTLYTGYTTNIERRLQAHNGMTKGGAKYTRVRRPVHLVLSESYKTKEDAMQREAAIKQMSREEKLMLL